MLKGVGNVAAKKSLIRIQLGAAAGGRKLLLDDDEATLISVGVEEGVIIFASIPKKCVIS
jgi:hypothetical protein